MRDLVCGKSDEEVKLPSSEGAGAANAMVAVGLGVDVEDDGFIFFCIRGKCCLLQTTVEEDGK